MNEIIKSLFDRKSCRAFMKKEIPLEAKHLIIDSAIQAPTAGNQMLYSIIDVTDKQLLQKLSESCDHQPFIATAGMALIFCADFQKWYDAFCLVNKDARKPQEGDLMLAVNDTLIAAQNAVVAAESLGIGSCYIGDMMEQCEYHRELLQLPDYVFPVTMLVFGYPMEQAKNRKKPKRFERQYVVSENAYHKLDAEELRAMFETQHKEQIDFDFETWMKAFYDRKYGSDFSLEMSRSVREYLSKFKG